MATQSIATGTTATQVVPARSRAVLILQNLSSVDMYVGFEPGVTAADGAASGIKLAAGETLPLSGLPGRAATAVNAAVYAVHEDGAAQNLRYVEIL